MGTGDYLVPSEALADNSRVFTEHQVFPRVVIAAACGAVSLNLPGITRCRRKKTVSLNGEWVSMYCLT